MDPKSFKRLGIGLAAMFLLALALVFAAGPLGFPVTQAVAAPGDVFQTPVTPMELPIEVEIELSPAGSLKQAALWKELYQLLVSPYAPVVRRPGFGVTMPPLNTYPLDYNFLTAQPVRLRTSDGEVSWDQPGPMFDTAQSCLDPGTLTCDEFNTPTVLRTVIGHLVACPNAPPGYQAVTVPANFCAGKPDGSLVVYNPGANASIPPTGTVVAMAAFFDNVLHEVVTDADGVPVINPGTGLPELEEVVALETPVNEEDFFRNPADVAGVPAELQPLIGRPAAEILGKALFWDMQIGSDGVQACGSCHFHAGVDNRFRGQLNPNTTSGDLTLQVKGPNQNVVPSDFPFHKLADPEITGESTSCGAALGLPPCADNAVVSDANDVMSSMGVSQFKLFVDIPPIGTFINAGGVNVLPQDNGTIAADPVPANQGLRRVEPRNTPTFHGAAFNFDNFWDGRARFNFNGGSVFGPSDPTAHIFIDNGALVGATMGNIKPDLLVEDPDVAAQPVRIKFSSLASQSVGPPLSDFEMSFSGRNWAKIGKKMLQAGVTPLANQLVDPTDSVLGPFSNQNTTPGMPGLSISYPQLIQAAFRSDLWSNGDHLNGAPAVCTGTDANGFPTPAGCDPFDGYALTVAGGAASTTDTNQFTQMEANFSAFFGLSAQAYENLTIPDDTPADRFFDANPNAGAGVGEPGDQAVLFPTLVPDLVDDGLLNGTAGTVALIPDDPTTPEFDGFGPDELFGFDLFAGANLTAALAPGQSVDPRSGRDRNPQITNTLGQTIRVGSNPFTRSAKCMLCHLGPEQTDHSINISHGLLKNDAEFEYPTPPSVPDPTTPVTFADGLLPAPEPSGSSRTVGGLILAEEVGEGPAQDAVEVEPRNFATFNDPATPWDDSVVAQPGNFAFGDQGVYNIGLRPNADDLGRGGNDPFGWPLSLAALTLKNIGGQLFEPCDGPADTCVMDNFDPADIGAEAGSPGQQGFELTGGGLFFPGTTHTLQSINPGFERDPILPQMPEYMIPWMHSLPAGELHPQIDEMAGMVPNTLTAPNGGPGIEFPEILFGADLHCAQYNPAIFGLGPPNFGWGSPLQVAGPSLCPQHQSGVSGNIAFPSQGTWPVPNRVLRDGAFKAPPLRNVELTGPYFHTGSFLTLRQVVDFYFRGGDFPNANAENRDPHIVGLDEQAFGFGRTTGADLLAPVNHVFSEDPPFTLVGTFADGLPDTAFLYDEYPDSDHPITPEPVFASREEALEDAKNALVKFLLALTDPRVKYERAPFDRPEIFVPINGVAPENTGGRNGLVVDARFRHLPAVGGAGNPTATLNFLGVASALEPAGQNHAVDHFDADTTAFTGSNGSGRIDFDGDGMTDIAVWRPTDGVWYILQSSNGYDRAQYVAYRWGAPTDLPVPGDYDGDGMTDIAVWRPSTGVWYILHSSNGFDRAQFKAYRWGDPTDLPVPGDYDGDGKTDIAVWRPADGIWYLLHSSNGYARTQYKAYRWGVPTDLPVPGDYDGDGKTDIAVWRPADGVWFILRSATGFDRALYQAHVWGDQSTDLPLPGDYDGDGKTDIHVWRPADRLWYMLDSSTAYNPGQFRVYRWGDTSTDVPVPGDYDGDGITDIAVRRSSDGVWYILRSTDGYLQGQYQAHLWGNAGDVPLKALYW